MKVVFAGGGTGGHIFPGIAAAQSILRLRPESRIEFWGSGRALEVELLDREGMPAAGLPSSPLPRSVLSVPGFIVSLAHGYLRARRLLKAARTDVVVGLGGYSSYAPVAAASHLGIPVLLLEQNALPGVATRRLAKRSSALCVSWEAAAEHLSERLPVIVTGNPVRDSVVAAASSYRYDTSGALLILGGSTGAVGLNSVVLEALPEVDLQGRQVIHQAGAGDVDRVREAYANAGICAQVAPFIEDMAEVYAKAAVVVARAGGTTLAELALFGLPAFLVPYPHHKDRHQRANAEIFARVDAAQIIEQDEGVPLLARLLKEHLDAPVRLESMHAAMLSLGRPEAADLVGDMIIRLAEGGRHD